MKVGITINDFYKDFLLKIANQNNISFTKVCSLIVENFLSYNKRTKKFPIFRYDVRIGFKDESSQSDISGNPNPDSVSDVDSPGEHVNYDDMISDLEDVPMDDVDPDGLPF